jgi:hypothetical protein
MAATASSLLAAGHDHHFRPCQNAPLLPLLSAATLPMLPIFMPATAITDHCCLFLQWVVEEQFKFDSLGACVYFRAICGTDRRSM